MNFLNTFKKKILRKTDFLFFTILDKTRQSTISEQDNSIAATIIQFNNSIAATNNSDFSFDKDDYCQCSDM